MSPHYNNIQVNGVILVWKQILKLLQDTARKENMTVLIITHNTAIAPMADKVIHFKNGTAESIEINENPQPIEEIEW